MKSAEWALLGLVGVFVLLATALGQTTHVDAVSTAGPDWIYGAPELTVDDSYAYSPEDYYELMSNIPCEHVDLKRNSGSIRYPQYSTIRKCLTPNASGHVDDEFVVQPGIELAQQVYRSGTPFQRTAEFTNPATNGVAYVTNAYEYYNSNLVDEFHYIRDWRNLYSFSHVAVNGEIIRKPIEKYDFKLTYPDGSRFPMGISHMSYSKNGRWMILGGGGSLLRFDTDTFDVFSFAKGTASPYTSYTSVSNSGRYTLHQTLFGSLNMYDLDRCEAEKPNYASRNCQSRDFSKWVEGEYLKTLPTGTKLQSFTLRSPKFVSESTVDMYVWVQQQGEPAGKYVRLVVSVDAGTDSVRYLALGDSFSSGEGAGNYWNTTDFYADENNFNMCHLSKTSYPYLLQQTLAAEWMGSVACSGATQGNIVTAMKKFEYYTNMSQAKFPVSIPNPVLNVEYVEETATDYLESGIPGYLAQADNSRLILPTLITLSVGGNDIGFGDIVKACVMQPECYSSRESREILADLISSKSNQLAKTYESLLRTMGGDKPRLYVVGYPKIISTADWCGSVFSPREREFADALVDYLNAEVKRAAAIAGVRYVDVSDAFIDYGTGKDFRLCGDAGLWAVNGLRLRTTSASLNEPFDKRTAESYHPNALGHVLMAKRIKQYTNNLQQPMPPAVKQSAVDRVWYIKLVGDSSDRVKERADINPKLVPNPMLAKDDSDQILLLHKIDGASEFPAKSKTARVELHSEPIILGELPISADGVISGSVKLPEAVEFGYHELHIYYTDALDRTVDVYQHVFVVASEGDYDGDGVLNGNEECLIGPASGMDYDEDGTDDLCDDEVIKISQNSESSTPRQPVILGEAIAQGIIHESETSRLETASQNPTPYTQSASFGAGGVPELSAVEMRSDDVLTALPGTSKMTAPVEQEITRTSKVASLDYVLPLGLGVAGLVLAVLFIYKKR